jgi:two-component system sensor histidine kinase KdpD
MVLIEIADEGEGIPEDRRKSCSICIFPPTSCTATDAAIGLGLSLCKSFVQAHGGVIGVRTITPGAGIFLTLPAQEVKCLE